MRKNKKNVEAGKKGAVKRWTTKYGSKGEMIDFLAHYYGDDKKMMNKFQFDYKIEYLVELVDWIKKYNNK
jgi:hypothetical protein